MVVEPFEPFQRDRLGPDGSVSHTRLRIAMPIAPAGPKQAELEGNVGEARAEIGIVARMARLHRIEPLTFEPLDEGTGPALL